MKKKTRLIAMLMAATLFVSSVPFSVLAENSAATDDTTVAADDTDAAAQVSEDQESATNASTTSASGREEESSDQRMIKIEEKTITEQIVTEEMAPAIEKRRPEQSATEQTTAQQTTEQTAAQQDTNPQLASQSNVSGESAITWSENTMPVVFDITSLRLRRRAYLTAVRDGYMRVAYDGESIVVEYYDENFQMTKQGVLSMELDVWGGFYKGEDAYYIVEGQYNKDCVDGTEVLRIIKYDFDWNRIGAGNILAQEGWEYEIRYPFDYSCVNMDEVNGKLYLITGREGYVDESVGQGHQGMMLIRMDQETFDTEIVYGDFWHSFSQYMEHDGTDLYICELSEGSRRTSLSRFDTNRTGTDYFDAFSDRFSVLDYGGSDTSVWATECYASADDIAISTDNVLCLGTSIDQSQYDSVTSDTPHNIYLTVTPKSDLTAENTTVKWLTEYSGGGKSFYGVNITKVDDDRFLIIWEEDRDEDENATAPDSSDPLSIGMLHYLFVDGAGNKISEEFTAQATISECRPILSGSKIVYYASNENCLDFYTIDAQSGEFAKKVTRIAGDNISWDYNDGVLSFTGKGEISLNLEGSYRAFLSTVSGGYTYSGSDNCWQYVRENVKEIDIGENITAIPERAFVFYSNLTKVNLTEGLKSIGKSAFYACSSLLDLEIPNSVEEIGDDILWTGYYWSYDEGHVVVARIIGFCTSYAIEYAKKNNIDYEITHKWNTQITKATTEKDGKIVKKCDLCGTSSEEVICYPKTISLSKTTLTYNGKTQRPAVTVKGSDGEIIGADNYTLTYSGGCKMPGDYSVKIVFTGNYTGTVTKKFKIVLGKTSRGDMFNLAGNVKVTWKAVPGAKYYKVYRTGITDPEETQTEPVIVTSGLIGWDKQPGLTNGHAYKYKIVASLTGKGDSSGDSTLSYSKLMYRLKTVVIRSAKNTAPGKVTVKYDKTTSGDSYVLQYCDNKDMVGAKTKVVLGAENTSYVISGLTKGKTYYISIRVRKKVDGISYYTTFGVPKKVVIRK